MAEITFVLLLINYNTYKLCIFIEVLHVSFRAEACLGSPGRVVPAGAPNTVSLEKDSSHQMLFLLFKNAMRSTSEVFFSAVCVFLLNTKALSLRPEMSRGNIPVSLYFLLFPVGCG